MLKYLTIKMRWSRTVIPAIILQMTGVTSAIATNGLNQIGFGAESTAMAGADIAVARDTSALNTNPAGLSQINNSQLDMNLAVAYTGNIKHKDQFGNDASNENEFPLLGSFGYAKKLSNRSITAGIGFFAQGGTGNEYNNLNTVFGTVDDLSILFRIARITPGLSLQVNESLSIGASIVGTYAQLEQEVFPGTSINNIANPDQSFFGYKLQDMDDFSVGIKLGLMYKPNNRLTLGIAYNNQVDLDMKGSMQVNFSALGLGMVTYQNAEALNINQPQELGFGAMFKTSDKLAIALELNWIDWSSAVTNGTVNASNPDNPMAPPSLSNAGVNNWRDQYVLALGMVYEQDSRTMYRAGYNYGRNPIPNEHLDPLLNTIAEHHLTFGFGHKFDVEWQLDGALEWDIKNEITYTNSQLPFGQDAVAIGEMYALYVRLVRSW